MKYASITTILLLYIQCCLAQFQPQKSPGFDPEKISFGGNFGLGFGDVTYINASPLIGYRLTEKFTPGVGLIYQYTKFSPRVFGVGFETSVVGASLYGRYKILDSFYALGEYQSLRLGVFDPIENRKITVPAEVLLIGGGYLSPLGARSYFNVSILFDVIEDINSPYRNPIINAGIIFNP